KLNHRADDDPDRFGVLAIHAPPLALAFDLRAVFVGRGIAPSRAFSAVASTLDITPSGGSGEMSYTIDGDLYRTSAPTLRLSVGPRIQFVQPRAAINAQTPALLSAPPGDTMKVAR
ncbi:MAG TPA: hypothetical protein VG319_10915, partial [Polyangia bacterium]|nr:hypothetical protein [Polyangia bacterium]